MSPVLPEPDYRLLFEAAPTRHMLLTLDYHIVAVSDAFLQVCMRERADIIGRYLFDAFPDNPDDVEASGSRNLRISLQRVLDTRQADIMPLQKYDIRRPEAEGGEFEVRYWSPVNSPIINAAGELTHILQRVEDVTDYVVLQQRGSQLEQDTAELAARTQHMESEIWQRSQEVARANQSLQQANEELRTLTYSVAHDLGAPLRAINSFARMLSERNGDRLDAESLRLLKVVSDNALTMGKLIDSLLLFTGLAHRPLHVRHVEMDEVVRGELASLMQAHSYPHEVRLEPLPGTSGDRALLAQVWQRLLHNAFKFSAGSALPRIQIGSYSDSAETVFFVRDNGIGFAMEHAAKLFGVFQRLHAQDVYPGTGIGLALIRRIIARHGGRVWAESRPHEGATFFFALPCSNAAQPADAARPSGSG